MTRLIEVILFADVETQLEDLEMKSGVGRCAGAVFLHFLHFVTNELGLLIRSPWQILSC